ncbi:MAG TPA: UDP-N-acetylglucosamine 2-epimerase (non-hydrolyzing) [Bacteroidia bacterium]|nr:UDP-N-acetylglucosamine 2-epimerase (non-hydrolyzing) [Bacteroidia bacterium]
MKIITIIGARPQFVKAAVLSKALKKYRHIAEVIVHTGQHFNDNMSKVFFDELEIAEPKYNLNVHNMNHAAMTATMMLKLEPILLDEKPDLVIVFGDTNSTLAGALTAKKLHIKVAHIEAGLRSFNENMPEETNRIIVDRLSDYLYCPTAIAVDNLKKEGYDNFNCSIFNFGDVMKDAAMIYKDLSNKNSTILKDLNLQNFVLATFHRAENTANEQLMKGIIDGLNAIHQIVPVVVPMHPRTLQVVENLKINCQFKIIAPVGYLEIIALQQAAKLIITDSGGMQKEAYFFDKYCITLREETEWTELVTAGLNKLVGAEASQIEKAFHYFNNKTFISDHNLYGDGMASEKIAASIAKLAD